MEFPKFNLELVAHGPEQKQILSISSYIRKYTENFIYTNAIKDTSVPIVYYES